MSSTGRRVVITGAAGYIVGRMLPDLRERYDLMLLDARTTDRDGNEVPGVQVVDLCDRNRDAYRSHFAGADVVIHSAFVRPPGESGPGSSDGAAEARYRAEMQNVDMAFNVYQTALEEGVRRVVCISSNHAADYYEPLILDGKQDFVTPDMQSRAVNYYGWAKDVYEHLGFIFALGQANGKPLENVQIRIGGPRDNDVERAELGDLRRLRRGLAVYISQRDQVQLICKSIEAEDIRDQHGVPFQIFYGISANSHAFWSIVNAREVIGYAPQDNSELAFAEGIARHLAAARG